MFNHVFKKICVICICTLLNACTLMVWDSHGGMFSLNLGSTTTEKDKDEKLIKRDQLLGFVLLQDQSSTDQSKLMIIGKHYAYQIDKGSDDVKKLIHSSLGVGQWMLVPNQNIDGKLKIFFIEQENARQANLKFASKIDFFYQNQNPDANAVEELKRLGASLKKIKLGTGETIDLYSKSISLDGEVVGLNQQMKSLHYQNFSRKYWIEMYKPAKTVRGIDYKVLLKKVGLTPFALVTDAIVVPVVVVIFGVSSLLPN